MAKLWQNKNFYAGTTLKLRRLPKGAFLISLFMITQASSTFTSAVSKENIIGCQFHPEKSQEHGLTLLNNFIHHNFNG